ncbi:MAG: hypothetical protein M1398_04670 [Deltaproteobacteria bacterium]|nr:hypothetical protein [Deltaproteobacteria bacterium]
MNSDLDQNAFRTAETLAEHLAYAWNYLATLKALQRHANESPNILDTSPHFFSTIMLALWADLFLKLAHCSDKRKEATGFPKLFKQLRAYLPQPHHLRNRVDKAERQLNLLQVRTKVENWRNLVIAHYTITREFEEFYKKNVCSLDEVESLIRALNALLHSFSVDLWSQVFVVEDMAHHACQGVDRLVQGMTVYPQHT